MKNNFYRTTFCYVCNKTLPAMRKPNGICESCAKEKKMLDKQSKPTKVDVEVSNDW